MRNGIIKFDPRPFGQSSIELQTQFLEDGNVRTDRSFLSPHP